MNWSGAHFGFWFGTWLGDSDGTPLNSEWIIRARRRGRR
jgi:hypothetical protein